MAAGKVKIDFCNCFERIHHVWVVSHFFEGGEQIHKGFVKHGFEQTAFAAEIMIQSGLLQASGVCHFLHADGVKSTGGEEVNGTGKDL